MKYARLCISCFLLITIISCKKQEVIMVPDAKMYADRTTVNKGDTVTFTNISEADYAAIFISRAGAEEIGSLTGYSFEQNHFNIYKHVFNDTGSFAALLRVNNERSTIRTFRIPITVNP